MKELNLPSYSFRITRESGHEMIFDQIRKRYVRLTDEEWVRQNFAQYLIHEGNYPPGLMRIEGRIRLYSVEKRIDILVHDRTGRPVLMVECKKPEIQLDKVVMDQITTYNLQFKMPYLVVTNGISNRAYKMDYTANCWDEINIIPQYEDLIKNFPQMIDVTCAIIRNDENEVLVVQRGEKTDHPFKWEFPGGKTGNLETHEECVIREVSEELSMDIVICGNLLPVEYDYGNKQIRLIPFICDTLDELPLLAEHLDFRWSPAEDLVRIDFCEADILVAALYLNSLKGNTLTHKDNRSDAVQSALDDRELQSMINSMMSMQEADWVATSAVENPAIFLKLLEYSYTSDKKLAFRASWTLTKVCDKYPELIYPYLSEIVEALPRIGYESVQRSFLRILSLSELGNLSGRHHGLLADYSFAALNSGLSAIAIKAYAMEILYKLSLIYPELANELASSIRILMEDGSAGIVAKGKAVLKRITGIPLNR